MMTLPVGNAPCSWGVEFADSPSNPPWKQLLDETRDAGYRGTELGPIGYLPEDAARMAGHLRRRGLTLTAGVLFQPFHDPQGWDVLLDSLHRTCRMLQLLDARDLVLIDSVSSERSAHAGNPEAAPRLAGAELAGLHGRLREVSAIACEEYGLRPGLHAHAGGWIEFEDELEGALAAVDSRLMGICLDTGHSLYAGFDPISVLRRHAERVTYVHLKDLDTEILHRCVRERVGFYEACARGVFCRLGEGSMDFPALRRALKEVGYRGWATVEQDRGPLSVQSAFDDAAANLDFLRSVRLTD